MKRIPLSRPEITNKDKAAVLGVLNTPYLSLGPKLQEFEQNIAKYVGRKYAVAVNSGTSALHLIIKSLGIGKGDEVITTPFSFIASANCILFEGAKVVFADIDPLTRNIDPEKIEKAINKRTRAILAVDIFGQPCEWDAILRIARKYKLKVIEDSCEAFGSSYGSASSPRVRWRKCGSFGDASVFSFYPNKPITMGEGGVVVTDNPKIFEFARSLRNQGRDERLRTKKQKRVEYRSWLSHVRLGYNYRVSEINCALGVSQLRRIDKIVKQRQRVVNIYNKYLGPIPVIKTPYVMQGVKISWMHYVVELGESYSARQRDKIIEGLKKAGIQASNYFPSIHLQPFYRKTFGYKKGDFPVSEYLSDRVIALPLLNHLSEKEIKYIADTLKKFL